MNFFHPAPKNNKKTNKKQQQQRKIVGCLCACITYKKSVLNPELKVDQHQLL